MRSGKLRHRIKFISQIEEQNEYGEMIVIAENEKYIRASIMPKSGKQSFIASQHTDETTHEIEIRYRKDLNTEMKIYFGIREFEIEAIINPKELNRRLILICKEYGND